MLLLGFFMQSWQALSLPLSAVPWGMNDAGQVVGGGTVGVDIYRRFHLANRPGEGLVGLVKGLDGFVKVWTGL